MTLPTTLYSAKTDGSLHSYSYDGSTFGVDKPVTGGDVAWGQARGSFMIRGSLYTVRADGTLDVRTFDGTTYGPARSVPIWQNFTNVTGAFYDSGRIYYTTAGSSQLRYRYFEPESGILGYDTFVASGSGDGFNWNGTTGLALVQGQLYFGKGNGTLYRVAFANGKPSGGVSTVSTTTGATQVWSTAGLFAYAP